MIDTPIKKYSIDTSAILQISKMYPADKFPDLFGKVWEKLESAAEEGRILIIDKVYNELARKDDFSRKWVQKRKKIIVDVCDNEVILKSAEIIKKWPKLIDPDSQYEQADPYLIAHAIINNCIIVTAEQKMQLPLQLKRKKDKIPNVCDDYLVKNIHTKVGPEKLIIELFEILEFEKSNNIQYNLEAQLQ